MSDITNIGDRLTPSTPVEITLDAETGVASDEQELVLIGHRGASGASGSSGVADYSIVEMSNVGDLDAAEEEANEKFGEGSELAKMVIAAVRANEGEGSVPAIKCCVLPNDVTDFGPSDEALEAVKRVSGTFIVSPYDGQDEADLRTDLRNACVVMNGPDRGPNNQFGCFGVVANRNVSDPANLDSPDSVALIPVWAPNSDPTYSVAETAAAAAARMAQQGIPFNPLDGLTIPGLDVPADINEWMTVGPSAESEVALEAGWTPVAVLPNGDPYFVRTVTSRITINGTTRAAAYFDVQDWQVLYLFRKTVYTRFQQPDFRNTKASPTQAKRMRAENVRMAMLFQTLDMFQRVQELAPQFVTERSATDRSRFNNLIPVNVTPGLHVIASNIKAGTQFDSLTVTT